MLMAKLDIEKGCNGNRFRELRLADRTPDDRFDVGGILFWRRHCKPELGIEIL